ncbi:MAG: hypothetical protein KatS3mg027_0621 [Bacteroidia bacterium]|nr:MAG: hypothetical protein KatS3mg027_0621 [Bacteroidia bacterium]
MGYIDSSSLFIINTLSGNRRDRTDLLKSIKVNYPNANIFIIKNRNDFNQCFELSKQDQFRYLIINGGDGTINSFLPILIQYNKILGILPSGSGNGLARTLGIPLNAFKVLEILKNQNIQSIDIGKIIIDFGSNQILNYFSCAVGFGIDAYIAHRFEQQKMRGLMGYVIAAMKEFFKYKEVTANLIVDNNDIVKNNFLILSVMNIPQYGNEFYLSPSAQCDDGYLNLVSLNKISIIQYPFVLFNLLRKKERKPMQFLRLKNLQIKILNAEKIVYHIDGEPKVIGSNANIKLEIMPLAIRVLC